MAQADGDPVLLRTLVEVFESDAPALLGEIQSTLDGGDAEGLARAAHTLKDALGVFAAASAHDGRRPRSERARR